MILSALVLAAALSASPLQEATPAAVAFTFDAAAQGTIRVALFDSAEAYAGRGQPVRVAELKGDAASTGAVFEGLPAGQYAAKIYHDLNDNGRMDVNPFGMPTEPFAFSNNAVGNMGPANWERARFSASGDTAQSIVLR